MARALTSFLLLPGIVAFLLPALWLYFTESLRVAQPLGLLPLALGTALLLACTWEFYAIGKGTLAPWQPPRNLVTSGPYRLSRNPMYVAVLLIELGWSVTAWSAALLLYALALGIAFHARIVRYEEPWLTERYGEEWRSYSRSTRRWL